MVITTSSMAIYITSTATIHKGFMHFNTFQVFENLGGSARQHIQTLWNSPLQKPRNTRSLLTLGGL